MSPTKLAAIVTPTVLLGVGVYFSLRAPVPPKSIAGGSAPVVVATPATAAPPVSHPPPPASIPPGSATSATLPLPSSSASNAEKIAALRDILAHLPEQGIPELKLATEADWHRAVEPGLDTPEDVRRALGALRAATEQRFARAVQPAVRDYVQASGGHFPTDPAQLLPFVPAQIELPMLQRYRVAPASEVPSLHMEGSWIITQGNVIDPDYHTTVAIGPRSMGTSTTPPAVERALAIVEPLKGAYQATHGVYPRDLQQIAPYAATPEEKAALQTLQQSQDRTRDRERTAREGSSQK